MDLSGARRDPTGQLNVLKKWGSKNPLHWVVGQLKKANGRSTDERRDHDWPN